MTGLAFILLFFVVYIVSHGRGTVYANFALQMMGGQQAPTPVDPTSGGGNMNGGDPSMLPALPSLPILPGGGVTDPAAQPAIDPQAGTVH